MIMIIIIIIIITILAVFNYTESHFIDVRYQNI